MEPSKSLKEGLKCLLEREEDSDAYTEATKILEEVEKSNRG